MFTALEIVIRWLCCAVPIFFVCLFVSLFEIFSIFISIQLTISPNRWALIPNNHWSRIHIYSDFLPMIVIMMMIFINARVIVVVASTEKQDRAIYAFTLKKFFFCFHSQKTIRCWPLKQEINFSMKSISCSSVLMRCSKCTKRQEWVADSRGRGQIKEIDYTVGWKRFGVKTAKCLWHQRPYNI